MTFPAALARTAAFALLYLAATYAGRLTVLDEGSLSLVWPAAGVLAVWGLVQRESRWWWIDALALVGVTAAVNIATGATPALAAVYAVANLVQGIVFGGLFTRWLPKLWAYPDGGVPLSRRGQLWRLAAAATAGALCGAAIGPAGGWLLTGEYSATSALVWAARNTVSILLIGVVGGQILHLVRRRSMRGAGEAVGAGWPRRLEYAAVVVVSLAAYSWVFGRTDSLPLAFGLIALTVWAALRLPTTAVAVHNLAFGAIAIGYTVFGHGPFAAVASDSARALVAQLFVGTLAVVGLLLALVRDENEALLAELRASGETASHQAQLMGTIVESMTEGVAVLDQDGRFVMRNPAAGRLLGGVTSLTGRMAAGSFHGLFQPDGTPLADDELPFRRALADGQPRTMDILVRNPGLPEGRILRFNASRLASPQDGAQHAVVVFHDVTADLRHRDELMSFAGAVAVDVLNPLTSIEGWTEVLEGELAGYPAADRVLRIQRAAARMRSFLNGLIAYTSARDGKLHPETVNLYWLVKDVANGHLDLAQETGAPPPRFEFGDLDAVDADPVLVRQLLENLVSNGIKFVAPGVVPHITVTTQPAANDLIRVDVTDNGIGILVGQREAVFSQFHRAEGVAGSQGTGLGLATSKRIVERHGGTITAMSNPDGSGTRMTFTLPRARTSFARHGQPAWPAGASYPAPAR